MQMAQVRSVDEQAKEVAAWKASGLSAKAYAARRGGTTAASLWRWSAATRNVPEFVRVEVAPSGGSEVVIEVGHARVRVARGFDAELLGQVIAALAREPG